MGLFDKLFKTKNQNSINSTSTIRRLTPQERQEIVDLHQEQGFTATEIHQETKLPIDDVIRTINAKQKQLERDKKSNPQSTADGFQTQILNEIKLLKAKQELSLMQQEMDISKQRADLEHQKTLIEIQRQKAELDSEGYDLKDDLTDQVLDRLGNAFIQKAENHILNSPKKVEKAKDYTQEVLSKDTTNKINKVEEEPINFNPLLEWDERTLYSYLDKLTDLELNYLYGLDYPKFCEIIESKAPDKKVNIKNLEKGYAIIHDGVYMTNE